MTGPGEHATTSNSPTLPIIGAFGRQFLLAVVTGAASGVGAVIFYVMLQSSLALFQGSVIGYAPPEVLGEPALMKLPEAVFRPWLFLLVPALGGLASGLIVQRFAPEAEGHGTDAAIEAYHRKNGFIRSRVPVVKAVTAAIVIGTGGSGGREGPIAQIGAGFASWLGRALRLSDRERRVLMAAGMGAGVGAIFKAPLAGALFAGEILYASAELEHEVLVPSIVASITAYSIFATIFGWSPLFRVPDVGFHNPVELIPYSLLAVLAALTGALFVKSFYGAHDLFRRLGTPRWITPALGGLLTGCVAFFVPGAAFTGYGELQEALLGHRSATTLIGLALLRILTTSCSIGSGGSGGVFGPSMVVGGCLGGAVGMVFHDAWPAAAPNPASFIIVGMAGFFAGIAHAPISTVIMVSEMTGNYTLLVPSMWVCAITFLMSSGTSLYRRQEPSRSQSPAHRSEFAWPVFGGLQVRDAMQRDVPVLWEGLTLEQARERVADCPHHHYPVIAPDGTAVGVLGFAWLRGLTPGELAELQQQPVLEFVTGRPVVLRPDDSLSAAAVALEDPEVEIVVVEAGKSNRQVEGIVTRAGLLLVHGRASQPAGSSFE
ncbi:MAG: chloride channel protein [Candidatus Wallbacteria bacterium]|nr:chloride channel protein [Candidatus Wallbacteria bacterium]